MHSSVNQGHTRERDGQMALLTNLIKKSVERNLIKKEPSMRETMDRAKDRYEETMREVGDLAVQSARSYAQPRHRGDGHMPTVANIPDPTYQHFALEELQSIILHMTYGEMVETLGNSSNKDRKVKS